MPGELVVLAHCLKELAQGCDMCRSSSWRGWMWPSRKSVGEFCNLSPRC